ncbi:MAG: RNA-binding protein [Hyphomicrobiales bacterium]|nr:RNA-binding protein [Hyphomicrobiales bacterium]
MDVAGAEAPVSRQRLDKWLWFARVLKSRTLAAKLVAEGHVRVNGVRADAPAKAVMPGDVLTISLERAVKVLRIVSGGARRGPYEEARLLYEDLSPPPPPRVPGAALFPRRAAGAGRPTKRERRSLAAWLGRV